MIEASHLFKATLPSPITGWSLLPEAYRARLPLESGVTVAGFVNLVVRAAALKDTKALSTFVERFQMFKTLQYRFTVSQRLVLFDTFLRLALDSSLELSAPIEDLVQYLEVAAEVGAAYPALPVVLDWHPLLDFVRKYLFVETTLYFSQCANGMAQLVESLTTVFVSLSQYYDPATWPELIRTLRQEREGLCLIDGLTRYVTLLRSFLPGSVAGPIGQQFVQSGMVLQPEGEYAQPRLSRAIDKVALDVPVITSVFSEVDDSSREQIAQTVSLLVATHDFMQALFEELIDIVELGCNDQLQALVFETIARILHFRPDLHCFSPRTTDILLSRYTIYSGLRYSIEQAAICDNIYFADPQESYPTRLRSPEWANQLFDQEAACASLALTFSTLIIWLLLCEDRYSNFWALANGDKALVRTELVWDQPLRTEAGRYWNAFYTYFNVLASGIPLGNQLLLVHMTYVLSSLCSQSHMSRCYFRRVRPIRDGALPFLAVLPIEAFRPLGTIIIARCLNLVQRGDVFSKFGVVVSVTTNLFPETVLPRIVWYLNDLLGTSDLTPTKRNMFLSIILSTLYSLIGFCHSMIPDSQFCYGDVDPTPELLAHNPTPPKPNYPPSDTWATLLTKSEVAFTPDFMCRLIESLLKYLDVVEVHTCQQVLFILLIFWGAMPFPERFLEAYPAYSQLIYSYIEQVVRLIGLVSESAATHEAWIKALDENTLIFNMDGLLLSHKKPCPVSLTVLQVSMASLLGNLEAPRIKAIVLSHLLGFISSSSLSSARLEVHAFLSGVVLGLLSGTTDKVDREALQRQEILDQLYHHAIYSYQTDRAKLDWTLMVLRALVRHDNCVYAHKRGDLFLELVESLLPSTSPLFTDLASWGPDSPSLEVFTLFLNVLRAAIRSVTLPYPCDWSVRQGGSFARPSSLFPTVPSSLHPRYVKLHIWPRRKVRWSKITKEGREWARRIYRLVQVGFRNVIEHAGNKYVILLTYRFFLKTTSLVSGLEHLCKSEPAASKGVVVYRPSLPMLRSLLFEAGLGEDSLFTLENTQNASCKYQVPNPMLWYFRGVDIEGETNELHLLRKQMVESRVEELFGPNLELLSDEKALPLTENCPEEISTAIQERLLQSHSDPDRMPLFDFSSSLDGPIIEPQIKNVPPCPESECVDEGAFSPYTVMEEFLEYLRSLFSAQLDPRVAQQALRTASIIVTTWGGHNTAKANRIAKNASRGYNSLTYFHVDPELMYVCEQNLQAFGLSMARIAYLEFTPADNSDTFSRLVMGYAEVFITASLFYDEGIRNMAVYYLEQTMHIVPLEADIFRVYVGAAFSSCEKLISLSQRSDGVLPRADQAYHLRVLYAARQVTATMPIISHFIVSIPRYTSLIVLSARLYACRMDETTQMALDISGLSDLWDPIYPFTGPSGLGSLNMLRSVRGVSDHIDVLNTALTKENQLIREEGRTCIQLSSEAITSINNDRLAEYQSYINSLGVIQMHTSTLSFDKSRIHALVSCLSFGAYIMTLNVATTQGIIENLLRAIVENTIADVGAMWMAMATILRHYKPYGGPSYEDPDLTHGFCEFKDLFFGHALTLPLGEKTQKQLAMASTVTLATLDDTRRTLSDPELHRKLWIAIQRLIQANGQGSEDDDDETAEESFEDALAFSLTFLCGIVGGEMSVFLLESTCHYLEVTSSDSLVHDNVAVLMRICSAAIVGLKYGRCTAAQRHECATLFSRTLIAATRKLEPCQLDAWVSIYSIFVLQQNVDIMWEATEHFLTHLEGAFERNADSETLQSNTILVITLFLLIFNSLDRALFLQLSHRFLEMVQKYYLYSRLSMTRDTLATAMSGALGITVEKDMCSKTKASTYHPHIVGLISSLETVFESWIKKRDDKAAAKEDLNVLSTLIQAFAMMYTSGYCQEVMCLVAEHLLPVLVRMQNYEELQDTRNFASGLLLMCANVHMDIELLETLLGHRLPPLLIEHAQFWRASACIYELVRRMIGLAALKLPVPSVNPDGTIHPVTRGDRIHMMVLEDYIFGLGMTVTHAELVSAIGALFSAFIRVYPAQSQKYFLDRVITLAKQRSAIHQRLVCVTCLTGVLARNDQHVPDHYVDALMFTARMVESKHERIRKTCRKFIRWFWRIFGDKFETISIVLNPEQVQALKHARSPTDYIF
ncbi:hypothetical protein GMRT_10892 [Giardia muris]|uniref:Uncharacterized protein n=1 Tax=Giardia muris TaxID=5742 RepID=A0A4Z1SS88_GIAMU|nr:hypothetical protein GMRT_10892 [Giardia muris]|eukprot:TNJ28630.1 hypothetical protein GMRT_10892 [Giardia muris]